MVDLIAYYFDASALIKLFVEEKRSDIVQKFVADNSQIFTTTLCVAEALRVFKRKYLLKKKPPDIDSYIKCCLDLLSTINDQNIQIDDQPFFNREAFDQIEKLILKHMLDLSDMLQILSIKASFPKKIGMKTILITDDEDLFCAAKNECIKTVWLQDQNVFNKL